MIINPDNELTKLCGGVYQFDWDTHFTATRNCIQQFANSVSDYKYCAIMCGIPASGKTTAAQKLEKKYGEDHIIIYDATLLDPYKRAPLIAMIKSAGKEAWVVACECDISVAMQRNSNRSSERRVPYNSMDKMNFMYKRPDIKKKGIDQLKILKTT